jgi:hypothetical protein
VMLQDTIVAIRRGGDKLVVANLEAELYPEIEFGTDPTQARETALLARSRCWPAAAAVAAADCNAPASDSSKAIPCHSGS